MVGGGWDGEVGRGFGWGFGWGWGGERGWGYVEGGGEVLRCGGYDG